MDVFRQRLEDEYDARIIVTAPTVPYKGQIPSRVVICCASPHQIQSFIAPQKKPSSATRPSSRRSLTPHRELERYKNPLSKLRSLSQKVVQSTPPFFRLICNGARILWRYDGALLLAPGGRARTSLLGSCNECFVADHADVYPTLERDCDQFLRPAEKS